MLFQSWLDVVEWHSNTRQPSLIGRKASIDLEISFKSNFYFAVRKVGVISHVSLLL